MGRIHGSDDAPGFDDLHTDFFEHFQRAYTSGDYASFEPAYEFGYEQALDGGFGGKGYDQVAADLQRLYEQRYPRTDYGVFEEAVRYAYERTRREEVR